MHVAILGFGVSGQAVFEYFKKQGAHITVINRTPLALDVTTHLDSAEPDLTGIDLLVKSPGVSPSHPWVQQAHAQKIPVVGEIDLALQELQKRGKTLLGITGSNGKTTTTLFTTHVLECAHQKVCAAGNIGTPLLSLIQEEADVFVIELSSFQIEQLILAPYFDAVALLNITPNHLDRYSSLEEYAHAKLRLQYCLKEDGRFICNELIAKTYGPFTKTPLILDEREKTLETILSLRYRDALKYFCKHDVQNLAAGYLLSQPLCEDALFWKAVTTFKKPPHRVEWVRALNGVRYINDSKATSVDAVTKAVESIPGPILLIAGGVDKGGAYSDWIPLFREKVKKVIAMGPAAARMVEELKGSVPLEVVPTLEAGFMCAQREAVAGDTVLLAPACSSYNEFRGFEERGDRFKALVWGVGQ